MWTFCSRQYGSFPFSFVVWVIMINLGLQNSYMSVFETTISKKYKFIGGDRRE